jgi:hypothetical protein
VSIVVRYAPASLTKAKYDETIRMIEAELGEEGPDGCDYHICFGSEGNLLVSEIWDSREKWEAFGEQLMPILAQVGIDPGQPQVFEVHNVMRR